MSMGNMACHADIISKEDVKKLCPVSYRSFMDEIIDQGMTFDEVARIIGSEYECVGEGDIDELYEELCDTFYKKTGLLLSVVYHDAEDCYDELDGGAFSIEDAYIVNPALEALKKDTKKPLIVERKFWTVFG
jgi:hypothetical protein